MILIRDTSATSFDTATSINWAEKLDASDIDTLVNQMKVALEGDEYATQPRSFEVMEVTVVRKVVVQRQVNVNVNVAVEEAGA